jgi:two-component system cell cycle sensor histidine kinase/response regulator CckA
MGATRRHPVVTTVFQDAERQLREARAIHQTVIEATADGIAVTDESGCVRSMNQRLIEMFRVPAEIRTQRRFSRWAEWGVTQATDPATALANYRAAASSTCALTAIIEFTDGRVFERHAAPLIVDGRLAGHVWCYRDLTPSVRADEERRRLEAQVQHAQKLESLGVLAGGIAHDFNNLLVGILGHAGIALTEMAPGSALHSRIDEIQTAAQRAAELVNQMLAYSGKGRFVVQACSLSEIAGEMLKLVRAAIGEVDVAVNLRDDLPAVEGDPAQMRQVIMNLLTNAGDAIGDRSGRIVLTTGSMHVEPSYLADARVGRDAAPGEYVFVEVQDDGSGMDADVVDRIFEPFFTTKFTGRGLGLAAVLGIVRRHQGVIKIVTAPGHGTTFRVLLPAVTSVAVSAPVPADVPVARSGSCVLVVDDEAPVRHVAAEMLKRAGFIVETAGTGEQALASVEREPDHVDAVLLDMTMPKVSGAEVFRRLRAIRPGLPVVLMSGYSSEEVLDRFGVEGLNGFVQKPFMPGALVRMVTNALGQGDRV